MNIISLSQYVQQNALIPGPLSLSTINSSDAQLNPEPSTLSLCSAEMISQPQIQPIIHIQFWYVVLVHNFTQEIGLKVLQPGVPVEDNKMEITNTSVEIPNISTEYAEESEMLTSADLVPKYIKTAVVETLSWMSGR